ncbi:hypothetical protein CDIK_3769 [Cucumispora dikerogammari]|nr:hypothetical protein CDIK_3769 [Cucumispora dikerogammari]
MYEESFIQKKAKLVTAILEKSKSGGTPNIEIITENTKHLNNNEIAQMPKFKSLNDKCSRVKKERFSGVNFNLNDIPDFLSKDMRGNKFLQFDKGALSTDRFIILFSEENKKTFSEVETVLIDGTFWSVPEQFTQLVTFNCSLFDKHLPLCFILMKSKNEASYLEAFSKLKNLTNCQFKNIIIDFELGLKNASNLVFIRSRVFACSFHFGQSILRKIKKLDMYVQYIKDNAVSSTVRMLLNLVFVPGDRILNEFEKIKQKILRMSNEKLGRLCNYFQKI